MHNLNANLSKPTDFYSISVNNSYKLRCKFNMTMAEKCKIGDKILDVIITQEKIKGKTYYVAQGIQLEVASQGLSLQEALENIKDAAGIILESSEDARNQICTEEKEIAPMLTRIFL
jgi:predicted RNase H-like HicB family nuclease